MHFYSEMHIHLAFVGCTCLLYLAQYLLVGLSLAMLVGAALVIMVGGVVFMDGRDKLVVTFADNY